MQPQFVSGETYRRSQDIHEVYGGQRQGGISTPAHHPMIFLFTSDTGEEYGYQDEFRPDGTFWYTGEGQIGDMQMVRGNKAIRDHAQDGRVIHLFEYIARGVVRYIGEAIYLAHYMEEHPDVNGELRQAIIFELAVDPRDPDEHPVQEDSDDQRSGLWTRPLQEVRQLALQAVPVAARSPTRREVVRQRSAVVRTYVLRRAQGICEACQQPVPFKTSQGRPYLEPHHIRRLADGGPDHPRWVAALCPNCHRKVHYGQDGAALNARLKDYLGSIESE